MREFDEPMARRGLDLIIRSWGLDPEKGEGPEVVKFMMASIRSLHAITQAEAEARPPA